MKWVTEYWRGLFSSSSDRFLVTNTRLITLIVDVQDITVHLLLLYRVDCLLFFLDLWPSADATAARNKVFMEL